MVPSLIHTRLKSGEMGEVCKAGEKPSVYPLFICPGMLLEADNYTVCNPTKHKPFLFPVQLGVCEHTKKDIVPGEQHN